MKRFSIAMTALAVLMVGCGGGGSSTTSTTTPGGALVTTAPPLTGAFTSDQCVAGAQALAAAAAAVPQALSGTAVDVAQSTEQLQAFAAAAPDDIKADLQTISEGYAAFAQVLADANLQPGQIPSAEVLQQLSEAGQALDTDAFRAAGEHLSTWFTNECGK